MRSSQRGRVSNPGPAIGKAAQSIFQRTDRLTKSIGGIMNTSRLASNIRWARKTRLLSQADLARKVGVHQSLVSLFESGDRNPSEDQIAKIAAACRVRADHLTDGIFDRVSLRFIPHENRTSKKPSRSIVST